jgi:uncharacterized protein (TIGR02246 family)
MKKLMTLVFVLLMAGCMQAPQTDLEGFKAMRDVWQSAYDAKDAAALAAIYAEDGALLPPNSETISSRAAIEAYLTESLASSISIGLKDTEVYAHGDVGYMAGTYTVTDAGGATIDKGKYVEIWRQVGRVIPDGDWQIYRAIWNSNLPLATPEPEPEDEAEAADED